jgi:hypothetical protein
MTSAGKTSETRIPLSRISALTALLAASRANWITAWRCCCVLSRICFGDRLRVAITISLQLVVVVRPVRALTPPWLAASYSKRSEFIRSRATTHINSHSRATLVVVCLLFVWSPRPPRAISDFGLWPTPGPKIVARFGRNTPAHILCGIPRPLRFAQRPLTRLTHTQQPRSNREVSAPACAAAIAVVRSHASHPHAEKPTRMQWEVEWSALVDPINKQRRLGRPHSSASGVVDCVVLS